ncbi:MAG: trypsin-like peptidase domain-containing protein [Planctomycetes bacterium]|nr:trypsin-like peptidase domain-containing protein [Planctomycetota bacterium]
MRRTLAVLVFFALIGAVPVLSQDLAQTTLDKLKAATVFVKTGHGTGSGFLFRKSGTTLFFMTCEHVVGGGETATIVFNSGQKGEIEIEAQVVATDPDRDLACLRVKDAEVSPAPLDLGTQIVVKETETVFAAGFPFGELLAGDKVNPEIAISKSNVASIRKDKDGRTVAVQLAGEINPGNSGGPVITAAGKVVGVAQSKIMGTTTAFAVPPEEIKGFLRGRIKGVSFDPKGVSATETKITVEVSIVDPLATLKSVGLGWIRADKVTIPSEPGKEGKWDRLAQNGATVSLKIEEDKATGTFSVRRVAADPAEFDIAFQPYYTPLDGVMVYLEPSLLRVTFEGAAGGGGTASAGSGSGKVVPPGDAVKPVKPANPVVMEGVTERDEQGRSYLRVVSKAEKANLGPGLLQIVCAPSGRAVYAIYKDQAVVKMFDPADWGRPPLELSAGPGGAVAPTPLKEITTPRSPTSIWCDEKRVVVSCTESKVVTFLDPEAGKPVKSVPIKDKEAPADFQPIRVIGKAADGSLMTLWKSKEQARWETWLYQIQESGQTKKILKGDLEWICYAGSRSILAQRNFRGSPSGVADWMDALTGKGLNLYSNKLFGESAGWHRTSYPFFPSFDRRHLVLPTVKIKGEGYGYQGWTYIVDPELSRIHFDFPGCAFAEVPAEGILVSWGLLYNKEKGITDPKPEVFYASRSNGRVIRRVAVPNYNPHPAQFIIMNPNRSVIYVPGHELVLATDLNDQNGQVFVIRCGPVSADSKVEADPGITVTNDPPATATVGKEVSYAPAFKRPAEAKSIVFKLKKGPEGITLDSGTGKFTWKPTDAYIGKFDITIVAEVDGAEVPVLSWTIEVGF